MQVPETSGFFKLIQLALTWLISLVVASAVWANSAFQNGTEMLW